LNACPGKHPNLGIAWEVPVGIPPNSLGEMPLVLPAGVDDR
jgi:hypothetical protein